MEDPNVSEELQNANRFLDNLIFVGQHGTIKNLNLKKSASHKWQFQANSEDFIGFDKIAEGLTGVNPIALVDYGAVHKYVVVLDSFYLKSQEIDMYPPDGLGSYFKDFAVYEVTGNFKDWVEWAKEVKAASWPKHGRKNNTVKVSLPQI